MGVLVMHKILKTNNEYSDINIHVGARRKVLIKYLIECDRSEKDVFVSFHILGESIVKLPLNDPRIDSRSCRYAFSVCCFNAMCMPSIKYVSIEFCEHKEITYLSVANNFYKYVL